MFDYDDDIKDAAKRAAVSGGVAGGILGIGSKVLGSKVPTNWKDLVRAALLAGGSGALVGGGSTLLGSSLLGAPSEDDPGAYTKRAGLGGAIGGGALGAIAGGLAARGKIGIPKGLPKFVQEYFSKLKGRPALGSIAKGAGLGAAAVGIPAAYYTGGEGMESDFINQQMKQKALRDYLGE